MPFPDDVLAEDEQVVLHLRPHWRAAVRPAVVTVLMTAALITAWVMLPRDRGGWIAFWVLAAVCLTIMATKALWPVLVWRCTHYVLTDERLLLQKGVLTRDRRDLPLARIVNHAMGQRIVDRLFGAGTLTIDSIGDRDPAVLHDVPHVVRVQTTLYELIESAPVEEEREDV